MENHSAYLLTLAWVAALTGCINPVSSLSSDQSDANPVSTNNLLLQASVQASQEAGQSADADLGSTVATEVADANTCLSVSTAPANLSADDIPDSFAVAWSLSNCPLYSEAIESGTRNEAVTISLLPRTIRAVTKRDLTEDYFDGSQLATVGSDTMVAEGTRRSGTITRTSALDANRSLTLGDGTLGYKLTSSYNYVITDSYADLHLAQRIINGSGSLTQADGTQTTATFENVAYTAAICCYPTGGTIKHRTVTTKGAVTSKNYVFGPNCGQVALADGSAVHLIPCN